LAIFGIETFCPNDVRNRYFEPCAVRFAASPPMICGTSASAVSFSVALTLPE